MSTLIDNRTQEFKRFEMSTTVDDMPALIDDISSTSIDEQPQEILSTSIDDGWMSSTSSDDGWMSSTSSDDGWMSSTSSDDDQLSTTSSDDQLSTNSSDEDWMSSTLIDPIPSTSIDERPQEIYDMYNPDPKRPKVLTNTWCESTSDKPGYWYEELITGEVYDYRMEVYVQDPLFAIDPFITLEEWLSSRPPPPNEDEKISRSTRLNRIIPPTGWRLRKVDLRQYNCDAFTEQFNHLIASDYERFQKVIILYSHAFPSSRSKVDVLNQMDDIDIMNIWELIPYRIRFLQVIFYEHRYNYSFKQVTRSILNNV